MTKKVDAVLLKQTRGTKRTCQNSDCGDRFYDLDRTPIICPICQSSYVLPSGPALTASLGETKFARKPKRVDYPIEVDTPPETAPPDAEAAFAEAETEEKAATEEDEPVLEVDEEEGGDVSTIIGGPVAKDEKEP